MEWTLSRCCVLFILGIILNLNLAAKIKRDIKLFRHKCDVVKDKDYEILHVKAKKLSSNDIIHYLWTTIDRPTIVTAHTSDPSVQPVIHWKNCSDYEISFKPKVTSISAFVLTNVFEYNDHSDEQDATKNFLRNVMPVIPWNLTSSSNGSDGSAYAAFETNFNASRIGLQLKAFAVEDYDDDLPHESISENSTRFTITLDHLSVQKDSSRYAVEVAFIKTKTTGTPTFSTYSSIDDGHTPGIFKLWRLSLPVDRNKKMFASWKPVAYNKPDRNHDHQTFSHNFPSDEKGSLKLNAKVPRTIMSRLLGSNIESYTMKVSFGQNKDGWYKKTMYNSWTGLVGYGDAPESKISTKVYLILSIGLGLPIVISLFGSLILVIRRVTCAKRAAYEQIN